MRDAAFQSARERIEVQQAEARTNLAIALGALVLLVAMSPSSSPVAW